MADIRNQDKFVAGRWDWDRLGYTDCFPGNVSFMDVDAMLERNGRFLLIENKSLGPDGSSDLLMPTGQRRTYSQLASLRDFTVLQIVGDAITGDPHRIRQLGSIGINRSYNLAQHVPIELRMKYLRRVLECWWNYADSKTAGRFKIPVFELVQLELPEAI